MPSSPSTRAPCSRPRGTRTKRARPGRRPRSWGYRADQQHRLEKDQRRGLDLEGAIRRYLNRSHLEDPASGCPSAALLPEIARQPRSTRQDYEKGLRSYVSTLAALLPDADSAANGRRAMAIFGLMVGTLQFARAVADAAQAEQILEGGVEAALQLARAPSP